ncbi:thioredoxin domain-containing protein [Archaeoglobus sp.]
MKKLIAILLVLTIALLGCSQKSALENRSKSCNYSNIEVYFYYSPTCPHCKKVKPYIDELREKYRDVKFVYCNVSDKNISKACYTYAYYVIGVPTVVVHAGNVTTALAGERDIMGLEKLIVSLSCCEG